MATLNQPQQKNVHLLFILCFTLLYMSAASVVSIYTQNWEFIIYIAVVIIIGTSALMVHKSVGLSNGVLACLSAWGLLHMMGGLLHIPLSWPIEVGGKHVLYSWWLIPHYLKFDNVVHTFGFATATWVCWQAVRYSLSIRQPRFGILALCVFAGMGLGALNEVIEFITTLIIPNTNVGGYANTGWDLTCNMIGSITAALMIYYWPKKKAEK